MSLNVWIIVILNNAIFDKTIFDLDGSLHLIYFSNCERNVSQSLLFKIKQVNCRSKNFELCALLSFYEP